MNLFNQPPLIVYLFAVLGLAAVGTAVALGVVADAAVRVWRTKDVHRAHPDRPRDRLGSGRQETHEERPRLVVQGASPRRARS